MMGGKLGTDSLGQFKLGASPAAALREAWVDLVIRTQTLVAIIPRQTATIDADGRSAVLVEVVATECD